MDETESPSEDAAQHDPGPGRIDLDLQHTDLFDSDLEGDPPGEEGGVFGLFGPPGPAPITAPGLPALQHRGQEAAGIVSFDGPRFHPERRLGRGGDPFPRREVIERLPGTT